ncbi:hypothetical protein AURDEDRAFT_116985 [Auricularia subglabra TFB-10046 SS5]|uniref:GRAM domain-containing protein n=1 Tax=Auricularia subglabra (strain TFB-10046 / SS5) TaxID=717982 RepID=J0WTQ3_AURST|nr:hypothetical protein AURDEDRAFT_116985 [Auricularia subglabra TFB-10046 SS5]
MSLNWAMLDANNNPIPLPNERTVMSVDKGVELTLVVPDAPPTGSSAGGGSGGSKKLQDWGKIVLTEQRLVFSATSSGPDAPLRSLSVPLLNVLSTSFQQPVFGANYLAFDVRPSPGGGLAPGTRAEIRFKDRGLQEFIGTLEKVRERALYMKREEDDLEDSLPVYSSGGAGSSTNVTGPPPVQDGELPPGYDA